MIAIATAGNKDEVERTKSSLGITFTLIPMPNRKVVEEFGLTYDLAEAAYATFIIDKKSRIHFKSVDSGYIRTSTSRIIKELQGIQ